MAQENTASAVRADEEAEDIYPASYADFMHKWGPMKFCLLPFSERSAILRAMLTSPDAIDIVQSVGLSSFATEYTPIDEAMPLLYDFKTNKRIAREACEAFHQNNTFNISSRWLPYVVVSDPIMYGIPIRAQLLFRSLRVLIDHYEPQTPVSTPIDLAILLNCINLERLDIEICTPEHLVNDPEAKKEHSINEAKALGPAIRRLWGRFGLKLNVWVGGPFATGEREEITWMWDRPDEELDGSERQTIMHSMWTVWALGGGSE